MDFSYKKVTNSTERNIITNYTRKWNSPVRQILFSSHEFRMIGIMSTAHLIMPWRHIAYVTHVGTLVWREVISELADYDPQLIVKKFEISFFMSQK